MSKKLIVLGSINVDHIMNVKEFLRPGETLSASDYQTAFGGKGANQAVAAGRAGANIQFISAVGSDDIGQSILTQFKKDNIDTRSIAIIQDQNTGVALIYVNQEGENFIGIYSGANASVTPQYIKEYERDVIEADILLMQLEIPIESIHAMAKIAKDSGTQVIVNPAPAQKLSDDLLKCIDIITPNETETELLTGIVVNDDASADRASQALHQKGISTVIITLGSRGAWLSVNGKGKIMPAYKVQAIDTIAAGDTFNGVLATALLENKSIEEAVQYANMASAIAVTRRGAQPSIPWRNEIERFSI